MTPTILAFSSLWSGFRGATVGCALLLGVRAVSAAPPVTPADLPVAPEPVPGAITAWALSSTARPSNLGPERCFDGQAVADVAWLPVQGDADGLVEIGRFRKPRPDGASKIWARTTIAVGGAEIRAFAFAYRDAVSLWLNGRIVFRGERGGLGSVPSASGSSEWNNTIFLPLAAGENELALAVTGDAGGWGFRVRDLSVDYRAPGLREVWRVEAPLVAPESAVYDAARNVLYVSNFTGDGFLSKLGPGGEVIAPKWVTGLNRPTGVKMREGKVYVVVRSGVVVIDPERAEIVARLAIPDAVFVNDLVFDDTGTIYVTDTFKNCVFKLSGGKTEVWVEGREFMSPNGITFAGGRLLVGVSSDGTLKSVDLQTKAVTTLLTLGPGAIMDGLVSDGRGGFLFSDYFGRIYQADGAGRRTLLFDGRGPQKYCADFEYVPEKHLLVVPSLYGLSVTAFRLELP